MELLFRKLCRHCLFEGGEFPGEEGRFNYLLSIFWLQNRRSCSLFFFIYLLFFFATVLQGVLGSQLQLKTPNYYNTSLGLVANLKYPSSEKRHRKASRMGISLEGGDQEYIPICCIFFIAKNHISSQLHLMRNLKKPSEMFSRNGDPFKFPNYSFSFS